MANRFLVPAALAAVLLVPSLAAAPDTGSALTYYKVKIVGMSTSYGPESWKSNVTFYKYGPVNGASNYSSQFGSALGYHVELRVALVDENGNQVSPSIEPGGGETGHLTLAASIPTSRGKLEAYVERDLTTPTACLADAGCPNPVYRLHFDMDGSSYDVDGAGPYKPMAPLPPGLQGVHVDITRRGDLPTSTPQNAGTDDLLFNYVRPVQTLTIAGVLPQSIRGVPDATFRLLNDIGYGAVVNFVHEPVDPATTILATYDFGVPSSTAQLQAFTANRNCPPPSCNPEINASIKVHRKVLATAKTDNQGTARFTVNATDLLSYTTRNFDSSALVVLAAQLKPESDRNGSYPVKGGVGLVAGAAESMIPITKSSAQVSGFEIDTRAQENATKAPDPVAKLAGDVNRVTVTSQEQDNVPCSDCGDAIAYLADREGILGKATINQDPDPAFPRNRKATLPVEGIRAQHTTTYRVLEIFYYPASYPAGAGQLDSRPDEFHSMALADRGFRLDVGSTPRANVNGQGTFWVNITSLNTNYDTNTAEPPFELKILARIQIPQAKIDRQEAFTVPEGQVLERAFPVSPNGTGMYVVKVVATTGDTLSESVQATIDFFDAPAKKKLKGIPGFEPILLALASLAAVLALRRKQAF